MYKLPPSLDKFLTSLGINTERLNWKIHYWLQDWKNFKKRFQKKQGQKYKYCACGEIALAEYTECPRCGRKLESYSTYKIKSAVQETASEYNLISTGFILLLVVVFAMQIAAQGPSGLLSPSGEILKDFGAMQWWDFYYEKQYWRLFAAGLIHAGIIHIIFNASAIWQTLPYFENQIGPWRTIIILTVTQAGAFGLCALKDAVFGSPYYPVVGASGMACGIVGFGTTYFHFTGRIGERNYFYKWFISLMVFGLVVNLLRMGIMISNTAHLGGFLAGLPLGIWVGTRSPRSRGQLLAIKAAGIFCLLLWAGVIALMLMNIFSRNG